ncbi:hypothetical protein HYE82_32845 [Streptomyces sp. BR123]|uniref:hypothetical protein n=1 Tax=Streptomyces sp. BR123 TaxID=2749828 RepID=UPI0015C4E73A|nr:hypothetical protein [Streptomyces sp. BR123]NXY99086.1 hypothetical protein [Streptomyces sp. BR123]
MKRRPLAIAAATAGVLATAAFALPHLPPNPVTESINDQVFQEKSRRYATAADARTRNVPAPAPAPAGRAHAAPASGSAAALPSWVPKDATDIRIRARRTGEARLIRFTLGATPLNGPQCTTGVPKRLHGRVLDARWWPRGTRAEERPECRDVHQYQVAVRGKRVYAWTDGTLSPGAKAPAPAAVGAAAR